MAVQRLLRGLLLCCLLGAGQVFALGLGEIRLHSALNQPLHAEVVLQLGAHEKLEEVSARLAGRDAYRQGELLRPDFLSRLSFTTERNSVGEAVIRISSHDVVREPALELLLDVRWRDGRMLRQYALLFDLPTQTTATVQPAAALPATASKDSGPARRVEGYGPVKRGEILGEIARRLKPEGVSTEQMSVALYQANPHAFLAGNINRLRWGTSLFMPSEAQMQSMSRGEAARFIQAQYDEWKGRRSAVAAVAGTTASDAVAEETAAPAEAPPAAASQGGVQLQILAPAPSPADAMVDELQQRLNEVQRINQAVQAENETLRAKLAELEVQSRRLAEQVLAMAPEATVAEQATVVAVPATAANVREQSADGSRGLQLEAERTTALLWWRDPFWWMVGLALLAGLSAILIGRFIWRRYRDVQYRGFNQALHDEEVAKQRARMARAEQVRRRFG